jgi:hypothetical protein
MREKTKKLPTIKVEIPAHKGQTGKIENLSFCKKGFGFDTRIRNGIISVCWDTSGRHLEIGKGDLSNYLDI